MVWFPDKKHKKEVTEKLILTFVYFRFQESIEKDLPLELWEVDEISKIMKLLKSSS